jgi:enoyl-[acyl-carrier protein] reductase I
LAQALEAHWGRVNMLVHSIAFANREDLEGRFIDTSREGFHLALDVSAYSLTALVRALYPLLRAAGGGSVVTMTYEGSTRVMPHYNVMGVAKAALEASVRYLAYDLGPERIRVNAISAGPVRTLASSAVKGFSQALKQVPEQAPLRENVGLEDLGQAALYLLGPWSSHVTGQILYVDSGSHIMGFGAPAAGG